MTAIAEKKTLREWARESYAQMLPIEQALTNALYEADYSRELGGIAARTLHVSPAVAEQISTLTSEMPPLGLAIGPGQQYESTSAWRKAQPRAWKRQPGYATPVHFLEIRVEPDHELSDTEGYITTWLGPQPWEKPEHQVMIHVDI